VPTLTCHTCHQVLTGLWDSRRGTGGEGGNRAKGATKHNIVSAITLANLLGLLHNALSLCRKIVASNSYLSGSKIVTAIAFDSFPLTVAIWGR
jgi:hypothetical protein